MSDTPHMWRDSAWKEVLSDGAQSAIEYLMPDLASDMDPKREMAGIPGMELFSEASDSDRYMRVADVFFDIPMKDEKSGNVALFVEQQHETDAEFSLRIFETYIRLREKRRARTTGLAIYTGSSPNVNTYAESCYGFEVSVKFRTYHLPSKSADDLRKDKHPFGRVMLAGRLSLEAGNDTDLRGKYAWEILNTTGEQDYDKDKRLFILDFSRRIFRLKDPKMDQALKEAYEMQTLPLREYSQQIKLKIARDEGRDEGREKGKEEGKFEVARSMLAEGFSAEVVRRCTGLGEKEISAIK